MTIPLVDKVNDVQKSELRSRVEKYNSANKFDLEAVLGLTSNYISGA